MDLVLGTIGCFGILSNQATEKEEEVGFLFDETLCLNDPFYN